METEIIETEEESEMLDDLSIEEQAWFLQGEIYVISMMVFQLEKQRIWIQNTLWRGRSCKLI